MRFARSIALLVALSVGGLSSSLALCLSACDEVTPTAAEHACHEPPEGTALTSGSGACPHTPDVADNPELNRDDRTPFVVLDTTAGAAPQWLQYPPLTSRGSASLAPHFFRSPLALRI